MEENLSDTPETSINTTQMPTPAAPSHHGIHPKHKKVILFIVIVLFFVLGITSIYMFLNRPSSPQNNASRVATPLGVPTPTPMPFRELTVPYLRGREYKSSLAPLEEVSSNADYTSYLTSYDSDGLKINALLTVPLGQRPTSGWPAIVFIHGYISPTTYQTLGPQYADYVDYFARNGFVVLKIDLRGHGNSEGEFGGGYFGSDYVTDTLNAYSALQHTEFINPQAIGLWGHSMAGNILLRSMAVKKDIPAIVIWSGAVYSYEDLMKYSIDDNSYRPPANDTERQRRRRELFEKHGSPSASSSFWQQVAPTNYLSDIKGAIQIHHATDDPVVNIGYSRDLMSLLDETAVPHELYEYQSGGHNLTGSSFNTAMQRTVDFFKQYLQ